MKDFFARFRRRPAHPPTSTTTMEHDPRQWRRERIARDIPPRSEGNVEFIPLEGDDLEYVATVAQALDNQWVSRQLLTRMLTSPRIQGLADVESERYPVVRAEYIRALVTSKQVVVNRAYMYNTHVVRQDYLQPGASREAFKALLNEGAIVPYLYREPAPDEQPGGFTAHDAVTQWQQICQEVRMKCVRLSWDDRLNMERTGAMAARFSAWIRTMDLIIDQGNFDVFMRDVGVPEARRVAFQERLIHVAREAANQGIKTREPFYKNFIVADGTEPVEGKYDPDKPFANEIKQLADLSYATNLPDALGRYALTPIDALPRTALQELRVIHGEGGNIISPEELKTLLQREAFSRIAGIQGAEFLKSLASLTLGEVSDIRRTNEWYAYIREFETLLASPLEFETRLEGMYQRYVGLAGVLSRFVKEDKRRALEHWMPAVTLVINIGSAVLTAIWNPLGDNLAEQVVYGAIGNVAQDTAGVVARLIIGGIAGRQAQAQLETSVDFMRARVTDARALWQELAGAPAASGKPAVSGVLGSEKGTTRQDRFALRFIARSEELYDANVNYADDIQVVGVTG